MASCERLDKCPFFAGTMNNMPAVANLLKENFCLDDKSHCARYILINSGKMPPNDLFPNDSERARELLIK